MTSFTKNEEPALARFWQTPTAGSMCCFRLCALSGSVAAFPLLSSKSGVELQHIIGIPFGRDLWGRIADTRGRRLRSNHRGDRIACSETPRITDQAREGRVECAAGLRLGGVGISVKRACQRRVEAVVYVLRLVTPGSESRGHGRPQHINGSST